MQELACLDEKRGQQQTYANKSASYLTYINATQSKLEASGYTPEVGLELTFRAGGLGARF